MSVSRARRSHYVLALVAVFVASRLYYRSLGVRFDDWAIRDSWQLLPAKLLRHDLLGSVWYLHSQPPLYNLFVGGTLNLPRARGLLNIEFVLCTLALTVLLFYTMLELAVPKPLAFVTATLFAVSPTTVLYENWMYYTYPVALLSVAAVWCFARYLRTKHLGYAAATGTMLTFLALTRASYHLLFVVAAGAVVVLASDKRRRRAAAVAVGIPLVLVGGWYAKNLFVFGEPDASSWLGMNLAHMVLGNQPQAVQADVDRGVLSEQALTPAFIGLDSYKLTHGPTGVPALDLAEKAHGVNNYNNLNYLDISRRYQKDAVTFIRRHPDLYARTVGDAFRTMFVPASDFFGVKDDKPNYTNMHSLLHVENKLLGQAADYEQSDRVLATTGAPDWRHIAWSLVGMYAATLLAGVVIAVRSFRRRRWSVPGATFVFLAGVVGYATLSSNMFELGENMRFRLETDPLVFAATAALVAAGWRWLRRGREVAQELAIALPDVPAVAADDAIDDEFEGSLR